MIVKLLLLLSLFFNIAHATLISIEDDCHHETAHEYILEQSQSAECGDICDIHHLFHFMAIINTRVVSLETHFSKTTLTHKTTLYTPPFKETNIKPPIA